MLLNLLVYIYIALLASIALFGVHSLILSGLFLWHLRGLQKEKRPAPVPDDLLPPVAVQLPLYNEKYVAEQIIRAVCSFDYPIDRLLVQVLDDSTDETTEYVRHAVAHYQALGYHIEVIHRDNRSGYKAGALAEALDVTTAEFVAVFDADFLPPPDFLKRIMPYFLENERVGMVQGRWGHLNHDYNLITRAQSLFLDGHVIVEQTARSRSGLLFNFNGTGGVWRTACIRDSGNWQSDTLSEDIDLSYRAQMRGWKMCFLPDLVVPAEVPPTVTAFKRQQYRWAFGVIQVLLKLGPRLWTSPNFTFWQRMAGTFHISTNLMHPVGLAVFLLAVPLALLAPNMPSSLAWVSLAGSGPSIMFALAQIVGYRNGAKRLVALPILVMIGVGIAVSNSKGVLLSLLGRKSDWMRTPKYRLQDKKDAWRSRVYTIPVDGTVYGELFMALYMAVGLSIAIDRSPALIPLMVLGLLSFGYVSAMGLVEAGRPKKASQAKSSQVEVS